jgi:hypothetical protein
LFGAGILAGLLGVAPGCGGSKDTDGLISVVGNIKVDGETAPNAVVKYIPQGNTGGHGGEGTTDSTGRYEITNAKGKKGLPPGQYKVTVSRRLNPDGSPPGPNEMPIESNARETLPSKYTDPEKTELKVNLSADDKRSFDFDLKVKKK